MKNKKVDKPFLILTVIILCCGLLFFLSASLGVLAKNESKFYSILFSQLVLGVGGGLLGLFLVSKIPYTFWKKYSPYLFIFGIILTTLVFIPSLSLSHGGATRWITFGFFSFQPAEILKITYIMYFSAWLSWFIKRKNEKGMSIFVVVLLFFTSASVLVMQPDTKSLILIVLSSIGIFFVSGIPMKKILIIFLVAIIGFSALVATKPYLRDRVQTFMNPASDPRGSSYQIQQSLIALGSGGMFGRGFGQSVQKFSYLPEPQGDSIFAVIGEEFGFLGTISIVILFLLFTLRGLYIANRAPDMFSKLLVTGLTILISAQSFLNMAALSGVFPLTGVPLVFISQGGTSLMFSLIAVGIILSISRQQRA